MLNLLLHEILSRRNAIIGWVVGLTLFIFMYTLIYPEMEGQLAALGDLSIYEAMGVEVATFEGYFGSTIIGFVPLLLGVYAVMAGSATLAGEEDNGTLEMLLTTRLPRWQIVVAKALGLMVVTAIIVLFSALVAVVAFSMIADQINTTVTNRDVFIFTLSSLPLVWALLMLSLFFGTVFPTRRMAMLLGFMVLAIGYFGEHIGNTVESMEVLRPFSLFTYFDSSSAVFTDGIAVSDVLTLLIIADIAFLLAIVAFQRRDVTVGNWPWQRVRLS